MKNLLTIGEVAKIKNISVKSLRYYEKIGILSPAYVNPETGYRYYDVHQLAIIDIIIIGSLLGIPLKKMHEQFFQEDGIDLEKLCRIGSQLVAEKMASLQTSAEFLKKISEHINDTEALKKNPSESVRCLPKRYVLTCDCQKELRSLSLYNYQSISAKYSRLYEQCSALKIADSFNQGILLLKNEGHTSSYVFLEIPEPVAKADNLLTLPAGSYRCQLIAEEAFPTFFPNDYERVLIYKDLYESHFNPFHMPIEVQKL